MLPGRWIWVRISAARLWLASYLQQRQYRAGHLLAVQRLVVEVAIAVLGRMGQQALLSAQNLVMQLVAHEVDDHPAV